MTKKKGKEKKKDINAWTLFLVGFLLHRMRNHNYKVTLCKVRIRSVGYENRTELTELVG